MNVTFATVRSLFILRTYSPQHILPYGGILRKMGAYTSKSWCEAHYNMEMNCTVDTNTIPWTTGDVKYGEFEPNGDIGGIGVCDSYKPSFRKY